MDSPLTFQRLIVFLIFFSLCLKFFSTNSLTSYVICIPENLTHVCHLTPSGWSSQLLREPIHIASVFLTFSFKPEAFSKSSSKLKRALAEFKFDKIAVVSSANCKSLLSKPLILIPLILSLFLMEKFQPLLRTGKKREGLLVSLHALFWSNGNTDHYL